VWFKVFIAVLRWFKDRKHGMQEASTPHEDWLKPHEA